MSCEVMNSHTSVRIKPSTHISNTFSVCSVLICTLLNFTCTIQCKFTLMAQLIMLFVQLDMNNRLMFIPVLIQCHCFIYLIIYLYFYINYLSFYFSCAIMSLPGFDFYIIFMYKH